MLRSALAGSLLRLALACGLAFAAITTLVAQDKAPITAPEKASEKAPEKVADKADAKLEASLRESAAKFVQTFDAGDAEAITKLFAEDGEFIDEQGVAYRGPAELKEVFQRFFSQFVGVKLTLEIDSIRPIGPNLAIEEGIRRLTREKEGVAGQVRYVAIHSQVDGQWRLASVREFVDEPPATPHDFLQPLEWLVGDWINEGGDATVRLTYRWSEDGNFLLGDFHVIRANKTESKSSLRIGWDPQAQKIRSWLFEADGSFSEARWTLVPTESAPESWVVKSTGTLADGQSGSATLRYTLITKDRFQIDGHDRLIGDEAAADFSVVIVRKPPAAQQP